MKIEIKGLDELARKLRKLAEGKYLEGVMRRAQARLMRRLSTYPSPSAANRPRPAPGRWYERGFGSRSARGRGQRSSEKMGAAWHSKVKGQGLVISNRASYAPFVMGARRQTTLHRRRGWERVDEIVAMESKLVEADLVKAVEDVLRE